MLDKNDNYKPTDIEDIVYGDATAAATIKDIATGSQTFPFAGVNGIILHGPNGTGKSALARILPVAINNIGASAVTETDWNYYKISDATDGKELIQNMASQTQFVPLGRFHYFILDEFDNLKPRFMPSMKSVMNCDTAVFIMTTNNISKIDNSIKSRSHLIHMPFAEASRWVPVVKSVLFDQGVVVPNDQMLSAIVAECKYDARRIMNATLKLANTLRSKGLVLSLAANNDAPEQSAA